MDNEKVVLEGVFKKFKINKLFVIIYCVVAAVLSVVCFLGGKSQYNYNLRYFDSMWENLYKDKAWWYEQHPIYTRERYALYTPLDNMFEQPMGRYRLAIIIPVVMLILLIVTLIILILMRKQLKLTITDKRVYGKAGIIKRVDLPNDMISAIATHFRSGVSIATSSGKINFVFLDNREEVFNAISEILSARQTKQEKKPQIIEQPVLSSADELRKYKDLLDSGIITQEEFDAKKKQLLGL